MPSALDDPEALPFAPGASPFHIKGIVYRRHVEYAEQFIPGGPDAVNAVFRDARLREFFEQRFLASSWYDALPIVPVWHACARVLGQPAAEFLKVRTRHQALHDIHGVYKLLLKIASAEAVTLRLPRVVAQYFDFGATDARVVRPGLARIKHTGLPALLAPWFTIVGDTYLRVALEIAGVSEVQVRRGSPIGAGTAHGLPLVEIAADVVYDATLAASDQR